jgi:hypothetical protein
MTQTIVIIIIDIIVMNFTKHDNEFTKYYLLFLFSSSKGSILFLFE